MSQEATWTGEQSIGVGRLVDFRGRRVMKLTDQEFRATNHPVRRFFQRYVEFPLFRRLGLKEENQDVLEIGCGSGYGAVLLAKLRPKSYVGIDLMPEQIELANKQPGLPNTEFLVMDASVMAAFSDAGKDVIVTFGVLHHIPKWRRVIQECYRVLRAGGRLFLEEPAAPAVRLWDSIFHWNHPQEARFSFRELEDQCQAVGFSVEKKLRLFPFGIYCLRK